MGCPLCGRDRRELADWCSACAYYVLEALGIDGTFGAPVRYGTARISPIVRHLAPTCYLCGEAPTEHADHVISKALGGTDTWDNLGGACAACNERKGNRVLSPTLEQAKRLADQQTAIGAALKAIAQEPDRFWLAFYDEVIDLAVEDILSDWQDALEYVGREDAVNAMNLESDQANFPHLTDATIEVIYAEVLRRVRGLPRSPDDRV